MWDSGVVLLTTTKRIKSSDATKINTYFKVFTLVHQVDMLSACICIKLSPGLCGLVLKFIPNKFSWINSTYVDCAPSQMNNLGWILTFRNSENGVDDGCFPKWNFPCTAKDEIVSCLNLENKLCWWQ